MTSASSSPGVGKSGIEASWFSVLMTKMEGEGQVFMVPRHDSFVPRLVSCICSSIHGVDGNKKRRVLPLKVRRLRVLFRLASLKLLASNPPFRVRRNSRALYISIKYSACAHSRLHLALPSAKGPASQISAKRLFIPSTLLPIKARTLGVGHQLGQVYQMSLGAERHRRSGSSLTHSLSVYQTGFKIRLAVSARVAL